MIVELHNKTIHDVFLFFKFIFLTIVFLDWIRANPKRVVSLPTTRQKRLFTSEDIIPCTFVLGKY